MIIVQAWEAQDSSKGLIPINPKIVLKFKGDGNKNLDSLLPFNIWKPKNWLLYLSRYKKFGKYLPRTVVVNGNKHPIVYRVYIWGNLPGGGWGSGGRSLFPGYNDDGTTKKLVTYGKLLPIKNIRSE